MALASLIVIRHAQAEHHVTGLTGGWTDTGLTALGRHQALRLARRLETELRGVPLALYTSDLRRTAETAAYVGEALGVHPVPCRALREFDNGMAAGKTLGEARLLEAPRRPPYEDWQPYPGAETTRRFRARVAALLDSLREGPDALAVLVTHEGTLRHIVWWWLGLDLEAAAGRSVECLPTGLTVLRTNAWGERVIERLNDTAHLADPERAEPLRWRSAPVAEEQEEKEP